MKTLSFTLHSASPSGITCSGLVSSKTVHQLQAMLGTALIVRSFTSEPNGKRGFSVTLKLDPVLVTQSLEDEKLTPCKTGIDK